jgi:hypothetical protein
MEKLFQELQLMSPCSISPEFCTKNSLVKQGSVVILAMIAAGYQLPLGISTLNQAMLHQNLRNLI